MPPGRHPKIILKGDIRAALETASSNRQAARYLGVDNRTFKYYAELYGLYDPTLSKRTTPKFRGTLGIPLRDIFAGKRPNYDRKRLVRRMISAGLMPAQCVRCGFSECRTSDNTYPIVLQYKDNDKTNLAFENLEFVCYNCLYLSGHHLNVRAIHMQNQPPITGATIHRDWESIIEAGSLNEEDLEKLRDSVLEQFEAQENEDDEEEEEIEEFDQDE